MTTGISRIVCIGAAHWDMIARADASLVAGADVPGRVQRRPGGVAANIAIGLAGFGLPALLIAAIGRDTAGEALIAALQDAGVDCRHAFRHHGGSDHYLAIETADGALHAAVADCRALEHAGPAMLAPLSARAGQIVLDGNLPEETVAALLRSPLADAPIAAVPASPQKARRLAPPLGRSTVANRREAEALCGRVFPDSHTAAAALTRSGTGAALVTDGAQPASWSDGAVHITRAPPTIALRNVTGAGDMLVAAHLAALAQGASPEDALDAALRAAATHAAREAR